jgi:hypothetical protein
MGHLLEMMQYNEEDEDAEDENSIDIVNKKFNDSVELQMNEQNFNNVVNNVLDEKNYVNINNNNNNINYADNTKNNYDDNNNKKNEKIKMELFLNKIPLLEGATECVEKKIFSSLYPESFFFFLF